MAVAPSKASTAARISSKKVVVGNDLIMAAQRGISSALAQSLVSMLWGLTSALILLPDRKAKTLQSLKSKLSAKLPAPASALL